MPVRDTPWPEGTPCWLDLTVDAPEAASTYYATLFGWTAEEIDFGGSRRFLMRLDGRAIATIGRPMTPEAPRGWVTFLSVYDVDRSHAKALDNGGAEVVSPRDVGRLTRFSIVRDPAGATVGLWEGRNLVGAEMIHEAHTAIWHEVLTRDPARSQAFYRAVVGHGYELLDEEAALSLVVTRLGEQVATMGPIDPGVPDEIPNHWMPYIGVTECDRVAKRAVRAGANLALEPMTSPEGRLAVLMGPQLELIAIITPSDPDAQTVGAGDPARELNELPGLSQGDPGLRDPRSA